MWFTEEKIETQLAEIKPLIHRQSMNIPFFKYIEEDVKGAHHPEFDDAAWKEFKIGDTWGGYDVVAWFRAIVPIPKEWKDKNVALRFLVGPRDGGESTAETLLYVNGSPLQAIDVWHEEAWLPPELLKEDSIQIALKAWSGVLGVPDRRRFKLAQLVEVDAATEKFYWLAETLSKALKELHENDLRRTRLLQLLNEAFMELNWLAPKSDSFYDSAAEALQVMRNGMSELEKLEELKPKVVGIGHSHIDLGWLWRTTHTREKASRTFSTVLHLMRQYPEYRYMHTSPQLYKWLKQDYPEIFEKVKARIASGEWEITGGMWVEPDTNVPNGESLIRQILFGKRYIKEEFGLDTNVVWLPDVFGYSWALPQIITKSGIDRFMTTKISWSQYNRFPHDTFHWRGIDGTELFTHFITTPEEGSWFYTYNGMVEPKSVKGIWETYRQKDVNDELLISFGWGDGGGGPTKDMIEMGRALSNIPGLPSYEQCKVEPYFDRLIERVKDKTLPVYDGELYLEYHRGTYTSQGWIKRANRKTEILIHNAEWLSSLADLLAGTGNYPKAKLNEAWELLLLNQFHDILPGSSIRQVYKDARVEFEKMKQIGEEAVKQAREALSEKVKVEKESIVLYNSLSWSRGGLVELPVTGMLDGKVPELAEGVPAPSQIVTENGSEVLLVEVDEVPSLGYKAFALAARMKESAQQPAPIAMTIRKDLMENGYYRISLNENGQIASIYDKKNARQVLEEGRAGNVLQAFEDRPQRFDAWDIDIYYQEKQMEINHLSEAVVEEEGPLRGTLRLVWKFSNSVITQRLSIYKSSPRIDFRTEVDWQEKQVLLKVAFPVSVRSTRATYDIQFGNIERPTHWNTSWDYARFEVCAQKWADLSEGNYGVSLLNDCKYGHDIKDNVMRLTLIKSPVRPDETADRGHHAFTYSLLPHAGDWREGQTTQAAYDLNTPLLSGGMLTPGEGTLPPVYSLAEVNADHVMIETVKQSEDGEAMIVRVFEHMHYRSSGLKLTFGTSVKNAVECNLVEEGSEPVSFSGNDITFDIKPYEIKTFKVWL